jgi:hypothetical protein
MNQIVVFLNQLSTMQKSISSKTMSDWPFSSVAEFVLKYGIEYDLAPLPDEIKKGTIKECFRNAYLACIRDPSLQYVEGYAMNIIPIHHAWVTLNGKALEVTWDSYYKNTSPLYFGVPFKTDYVDRVIAETGTYGVLDQWRVDFPLLAGRHTPDEFYQASNP